MYEDLNQIAQLKFNKEIELISKHTLENVREKQNEFAALPGSIGLRSGQQESIIGRIQIDGAERLLRSLFEIWMSLIKKKKGEISRQDIGFITNKIDAYARTKSSHLHKAFSRQRAGAVIHLLSQEAEMRLHAVAADLRRDLEIMVRENEAFPKGLLQPVRQPKSRIEDIALINEGAKIESRRDTTSPNELRDGDASLGSETPRMPTNRRDSELDLDGSNHVVPLLSEKTIWAEMWSWVVVGSIILFIFGGGIAFMTSGHPWAADDFFCAGTVLFLAKFWTWEAVRKQRRNWVIPATMTFFSFGVLVLAFKWNHDINRVSLSNQASPTTAAPTQPTVDLGHQLVNEKPPRASKQRTISIAERVKVIIGGHLQVDVARIKPEDDFEVDLGADPADVYFLMRALEQEYNITIPATDSKKLHTVGETIAYIEAREHSKEQ